MCDLPEIPIVDDIIDVIEDIFDPIIDIVEDIIGWLIPIPEIPDFDIPDIDVQNRGILINKVSSGAMLPIVYGMRRVGGTICFLETSTNNEYLFMVLALGEGEFNACKKLFIEDEQVTDLNTSDSSGATSPSTIANNTLYYGKFADTTNEDGSTTNSSHLLVEFLAGTDNQNANQVITSSNGYDRSTWVASTHRLFGVSYLALRFKYNASVYSSLPRITALCQGRKITTYDSNSNATANQYSSNPAFCLLDYLTNTRFGKGININNINIPSFYTASLIPDTNVTPTGSNVTNPIDGSLSTQINLMDMCIVLDATNKVLDNIRQLLFVMRGMLSFSAGKYNLVIETTGSSVLSISESDIIGGLGIRSENKTNKYNRVIIDFADIDKNFQTNTAQFPPIDDSSLTSADRHATMKSNDGGELLEGRFSTTGITSIYQAQEHAEVILRRSRNALQVSLKVSGEAMNLVVGDIIALTHATPGFSNKLFRVSNVTLNKDHTVNLNLQEHQDNFYTFATQSAVPTITDTVLPNPLTVSAPASVTLTDDLIAYNDGTVLTRLNIVVGASTDKFVTQYQVEVKKAGETNFKILAVGSQLTYQMLNVIDNNLYTVRVKALNTLGVSSTYTQATRTIVGATESPEDVTDFSCEVIGNNQIRLTWTAVTDLDISFYSIRYQPVTSGGLWANSTNLIDVPRKNGTSTVVSLMDNVTYMIKAVDKLGNESINELSVVNTISNKQIFNATSLNETSSFNLGTYDNSTLTTDSDDVSIIKLDTKTLFEDTIGNFDSPSGFFELGGTDETSNPNNFNSNIASSGFYNFYNTFDMGFVGDINFTIKITMNSDNNYDQFDDSPYETFEAHPSPFDGSDGSSCKVIVQVATSTDNNTFSDFHNCTASTYNGRYFKFRIKLQSLDNQTTPQVNAISISADLDQRTVFDDDVASGTSAKVITFPKPFYATPSLNVIGQNMVSGDYYTVTSKTKNGFTINFYNSSNVNVNRTFDYQAVGYGVKTA